MATFTECLDILYPEQMREKAKEYVQTYKNCSEQVKDAAEIGFINGWSSAIENQWISIYDMLPEVDKDVLVLTHNGKASISKLYFPKNSYGDIVGESEWKGSKAFRDSIVAWMPIPTFKNILEID